MNNIIELPIEHLSYSALKCLCSNPHAFKKQYILNVWDIKDRPSAVAGKGAHKVLELFYSGMDLDQAIKKGIDYTESIPDKKIDFGKTGSRADIIKNLTAGINFFMAEQPSMGKVMETEKSMIVPYFTDDIEGPLPLKGKSDLISEMEDGLHIWDWKFVKSHSDPETENSSHIIQAMFNFYLVRATYKRDPVAMHFLEVKLSKNKDVNACQVEDYMIDFPKHPEYHAYFNALYTGAIQLLANPDYLYLPNFGDTFTGKEAWQDFMNEISDVNQFSLPKNIIHRSALHKKITDKRFVESTANSVTADTLSTEEKIASKFLEFGLPMEYAEKHEGANVTLYMYRPSRGVKMADVKKYDMDIAQVLGRAAVRIEAPVLGTKYVGIEVANATQKVLPYALSLVKESTLEIPIGQDTMSKTHYIDLAKAPHLLVAGATGSGKSVFLNTLISTLAAANSTDRLGLILIDPKMSEFSKFVNLEHNLPAKIMTEQEEIVGVLDWAIFEMNRRYKLFKDAKVRDIDEYNEGSILSKIVIVIDEFADIMLSEVGKDVEKQVVRLAQKARAAGIHLVVATQRPSVNVITGLIKANFPTRIAFMVSSSIDSKVIIDQIGAESLIGNGDCLVLNPRVKGLTRLQAFYI